MENQKTKKAQFESRYGTDGKMDYDMAKAVISPTMQRDYDMVSSTTY